MNSNLFKSSWDFATKVWTKDITITNYKETIREAQCYCGFFLVSAVLSVIIYFFSERTDNELYIISYVMLAWLFISFLPLIFGFIILLSKIEKIPFTKTSDCNRIHNCKDAIKEVIIEKDIAHTTKFTKGLLQKYDNYITLITDFENATKIEIIDDSKINTDSKDSIGGRYRCVISNPNYYKAVNSKRREHIEYFLSNQRIAEQNQYQRIFSLPKENNKSCLSKEESKTMFFYVLSNVFSGIETFVLEVDKTKNYDFFKSIDYVIADIFKTNMGKSTLYFSYAIDDANSKKILKTNDDCLVHIMQNDFNSRIKICNTADSNENCMKISISRDREYTDFMARLNISLEEEKIYLEELKEMIMDRKNGINLKKIGNNQGLLAKSEQMISFLITQVLKNE